MEKTTEELSNKDYTQERCARTGWSVGRCGCPDHQPPADDEARRQQLAAALICGELRHSRIRSSRAAFRANTTDRQLVTFEDGVPYLEAGFCTACGTKLSIIYRPEAA